MPYHRRFQLSGKFRPISMVSRRGDADQLAKDFGANIHEKLREAAAAGIKDKILDWLEAGADPRARNEKDLSAIDLAQASGHHEIVELLKQKAAELDSRDQSPS
jgi:ankyrin repeat protein